MSSLVIHSGSLGDCVLAIQFAAALRNEVDSALIAFAARSSIAKWAAKHCVIEAAVSLDHITGAPTLAGADRGNGLSGQSFDDVVNFAGALDEKLGSLLRVGCGGRLYSVDPRLRQETIDEGRHITGQWAADLNSLGWDVNAERIGTQSLAADRRDALRRAFAERFGSHGRRSTVVHPGSGGLAKCLPLEVLERTVAELLRAGWFVVWMIGPDEVERFGTQYAAKLSTTAPVIFEDEVLCAADMVAGVDVFVGHDAGMTHVAALAGVRTIAAFITTDPRVWRPLGARVAVMYLGDGAQRAQPNAADCLVASVLHSN